MTAMKIHTKARGENMAEQQPSAEYYQILEELQAVDFLLLELTLYLDTHPRDVDAKNQFHQYAEYKNQVRSQFEQKFGPLQQFTQSATAQKWNWNEGPWPWQV